MTGRPKPDRPIPHRLYLRVTVRNALSVASKIQNVRFERRDLESTNVQLHSTDTTHCENPNNVAIIEILSR